jgi:hypothetical protein
MESKKISEIDVQTENWKESIFLTFDFDWASDFVLEETLDLLDQFDVSATFFVTHSTPLLERIRQNPRYELGIHPNFDDLLIAAEKFSEEYADGRFLNLLKVVPEALSWRSHSTTNSSRLLEVASKTGILFDCNYLIPYNSGIVLRPWTLWNNMIRCPYFFEDDVSLEYKLEEDSISFLLERKGLKIFDFHPIHIYLNTDSLAVYESSRPFQRDSNNLKKFKNHGKGTRDKLLEILEMINK